MSAADLKHSILVPCLFSFPALIFRTPIHAFYVYYQCPLFIYCLLSFSISHTHSSFCFPHPATNHAASISTCAGFFPHWTWTRVSFFAALEILILFCCFDNFGCICGAGIIHLQTLITSTIVPSIWTRLWWHLVFLLLWTSLLMTQLDSFFILCPQNPSFFCVVIVVGSANACGFQLLAHLGFGCAYLQLRLLSSPTEAARCWISWVC